ncbi:MAG: acyltransferase [Acetobacteraceae bacterium]|nr:acyltransferase [Acetobacteraceae bacterium]
MASALNSHGKLRGVEAGRGIAALLVVLVHSTDIFAGPRDFGRPIFDGLFGFGFAGVDFFFVLSGFIITYVHGPERPLDWRRYAFNRVVRIYPAYWAALLILGAILAVSPTHSRMEQTAPAIISSVLLLPAPQYMILGPAWSLCHEIVFYLVFGCALYWRRLLLPILAVWAGFIALVTAGQTLGVAPAGAYPWSFLGAISNAEFFCGIGVASLVLHRPVTTRPALAAALLAAGVLIFFATGVAMTWGGIAWNVFVMHALFATGAALALYGIVRLERAGRLRVPSLLVAMGGASYSIYLMHVTIVMLLQQALRLTGLVKMLPPELTFIAVIAVTVACGMVFSATVEMRLIAWLRARRPRPTARSAGARA